MLEMFRKLLPVSSSGIRCPSCGSEKVRRSVKQPLGSIMKDGPTVAAFTCRSCGHRWSVTLRRGP